jgi:O-antigen ligase
VDYYQVWDEPNLADHWGGGPVSPPAYADLLARTATLIRQADPGARILLAGLAPTVETGPQNLSDVRYLDQLYQAGAAPYFDVAAGKPYGFDTGPGDRRASEQVLNFSRFILLREVMVRHGDTGKPLWASHWGWNALPPAWQGAPSLWGQTDEATQATRTVQALDRARVEWPWCGVMFLEHYQPSVPLNDPHWGFALVGRDGAPRPVYDAVAAWAAALPDVARPGGYPADNPWAVYEGDWRLGDLGAAVGSDGGRAAFRFDGASVALTVRRGPYRAFLYISVDGAPANALPRDPVGRAYTPLYDNVPAIATVPLATGLAPGPHTVEIVAEGEQSQWALVDWRVGVEPVRDGFGWKLAGLIAAGLAFAALLIHAARQVPWAVLGRRILAWPEWAQVTLAVGLTGLLWLTAGASWGRGWGSPWLAASLLLLPALAALFALRPDLGLALVALTAPFYLHPGNMLYRAVSLPEVLVVLCGAGVLVRRSGGARETRRQGDRGKTSTFLDFAVLLLVLAAIVAGVAAADKRAALFELRAVFLLPALYYLLLRKAPLDERARRRLVDGWILGAVGVALVGLVQYALGRNLVAAEGGLPRLQSVYFSPNNVGLYLGRVWPVMVAVALWEKRGRRHTLYALALLPVTLALVLSFSRGALLLGIPAALLVMGWRAGGKWRWMALALVVSGALLLIPLLRVPRFASLLDLREGSTFFRLELWKSTLAMIRDHPLFGVGPGNFQIAYRTRYILPTAWAEPNLEHPHSIYLDHWTRLGLLGVLAGALVQVGFWRSLVQGSKPSSARASQTMGSHHEQSAAAQDAPGTGAASLSIGLAGSMAALLAHGLVDNTLFFPDLALVFFLTLALTHPATTCPGDSTPAPPTRAISR